MCDDLRQVWCGDGQRQRSGPLACCAACPSRFFDEVDDRLVLVSGALAEADLAGSREGVVAVEHLPGDLSVLVALGAVTQLGVHEAPVAGDAAAAPLQRGHCLLRTRLADRLHLLVDPELDAGAGRVQSDASLRLGDLEPG